MMKLQEALLKLDPTNEDHWTQDGAPLLGLLTDLCGFKVTREAVTKHAPSFSRSNPTVDTKDDAVDETPTPEAPTIPVEDGDLDITVPVTPTVDPEAASATVKEFATKLEELEAKVTEARKAHEAAKDALVKATEEMNAEVRKHMPTADERRAANANSIKRFQKSELKRRKG
ncbi:coil containing protein [Vibrio phage 2.117.O._10N.261.45.E9]|nr:coil containing protein [Vibrio phage 1.117.O._10N.261.45.E9]AUR95433.1 coil containing protein [Vibrio phage 1.207.B._10N.222.51.C2]AUS02324.1 coil containing protein [Vibrio phage 2.117.O._10N.261.45.E9]